MSRVDPPGVGLAAVFGPAQPAQTGAQVPGPDGRAPGVARLQAALTRLAGLLLGTGQRGLAVSGAPLGARHSAGAS